MRQARVVGGQRNAVGGHTVHADVLASQDGGAGRHANRTLVARLPVDNSVARQTIEDRRLRNATTGAAKRIVSLLVCCDKQNFLSHETHLRTKK